MIVKRIIRNADGELEATLMLTPEQASFLMNMGLGVLVQKGAATIKDYSEEEFLAEAQKTQAQAVSGSADENGVEHTPTPPPAQPQSATTVPTDTKEQQRQKDFLASVDVELLHKA